jgi:hypothetical protein
MRRVILLALLALALPTASLANSLGTNDYVGTTTLTNPALVSGSIGGGSLSVSFSQLSVNGAAAGPGTITISVSLGAASSCGSGCSTAAITGGTVNVWNGSSVSLFHGTFGTTGGTATLVGNSLTIQGVTTGGNTIVGVFKLGKYGWQGSSDVFVTPEPGTLGLLGTGLIGLAGIVRKKLRG